MKNRQFWLLVFYITSGFCILWYHNNDTCSLLPSIYDKVDLIDTKISNIQDLVNGLVDNQDYIEFLINKKKEL